MTHTFVRALLSLLGLLLAMVAPASAALAQTESINWADIGSASLTAVPNPSTVAGSDGTTATVSRSVVTSGSGSFTFQYGDYLSFYSGDVGGFTNSLLFNFDNASYDPNDKITYDIVLSEAVKDLRFTLGDIDNGAFTDSFEVYYDDGSGTFTNAANTTSFWTANSGVTRTNDSVVNGWRGTSNSDTTSTIGNLAFDFGNTAVERIRIVYFSYTGTGDPSWQFAAMSGLSYSRPGTDISVSKQLLTSNPTAGSSATYRLTVTNATRSTADATGLVIQEFLPSGFSFQSASGAGTYNSSNNQWSVSSLAIGASATIDITGTVNATAGATLTNVIELIAGPTNDQDSNPNNGSTSEDDYASVSFTVAGSRVAGTPPTLFCPVGTAIFNWDAIAWTAGTTNNSYPLSTMGNINFALSNQGVWLNNAAVGGQSPSRQNVVTGGQAGTPFSLLQLVDMPNQSSVATTVVTLPRSVLGAQFTIFDVDYAAGQFADRVTITGAYKGSTVVPTVTNGIANYVIGNTAYGDGDSPSADPNGNIVITFDEPIDQITIEYGNHSLAPTDPGQQGIALYDMTFCMPTTTLSATKISTVFSDPVNDETNPKAIPGAVIDYVISVSNTGDVEADDGTVALIDVVPSDTKFCLADLAAGAGPVIFEDPSGNSGLSYSYSGVTNTGDDLSFSNDGGNTYTYAPVADADGCDANITHFRVTPSGAFVEGTSINLRARFVLN